MTTVTSNNEWNNNITRKNSRILSYIRSHTRIIKRKSYIFEGVFSDFKVSHGSFHELSETCRRGVIGDFSKLILAVGEWRKNIGFGGLGFVGACGVFMKTKHGVSDSI